MGKKKDLEDKEVILAEKPQEIGKSEDSVREIAEAFDKAENTIAKLEEKETTLVALVPILFRGRLYKVGEELPTNDSKMVELWLEAESAYWKDMG